LQQTRKSIPEKIKEEAYQLFISGESCKDIYSLIKKIHYANKTCEFTFDPLKNYLYDRNKRESLSYKNLSEIYKVLKENEGITKNLISRIYGEETQPIGLAFTSQEQVLCGIYLLFFFNLSF